MIRRTLLLVLIPILSIGITSCEDLEDNTPALQVMVNGELFKADEMHVTMEKDSGYTLTGVNETSALNIYLTNISQGSHVFDETSENIITFRNDEGAFTTAIENGGGELILTEAGGLDKSGLVDHITGTFHFLASDTSGARMQGTNGQVYEVPFGSGDLDWPELEDKAELIVNEEEVRVTAVEAEENEETINIEILGTEDQRVAIQVPQSIEVGEVTLPNNDVSLVYFSNGESHNVESGTLEVEAHDQNLGLIKAIFNVETEQGHEVVGAFQVFY